jgi:hypothetical protein
VVTRPQVMPVLLPVPNAASAVTGPPA